MNYIPILLFYETNFNISTLNKHCFNLFNSNFLTWLHKSDFTTKYKFIFSPKINNYIDHPLINIVLGDSLLYLSKNITLSLFESWLLYHSTLYRYWHGQIYEYITFSHWNLSGELGVIIYQMIQYNCPMPIDVLISYFYKNGLWNDIHKGYIYIILEGFDTSCYCPVYSGDLIGITQFLIEFDDTTLYDSELIPIPNNATTDLINKINEINLRILDD